MVEADCATWDHPRVCGEKAECSKKTVYKRGSPPRVRGKERHCLWAVPLLRITPACAGKSSVGPNNPS